tara:strand:+ start:419 stop:559 length:141 start_codon:yes stop_codon:yes gene_type:complete
MHQAELEDTSVPVAVEICFKVFLFSIGLVYAKAFIIGVGVVAQGLL